MILFDKKASSVIFDELGEIRSRLFELLSEMKDVSEKLSFCDGADPITVTALKKECENMENYYRCLDGLVCCSDVIGMKYENEKNRAISVSENCFLLKTDKSMREIYLSEVREKMKAVLKN